MRLIARFAKEKKDFFELVTIFEEEIQKEQISKTNPKAQTITDRYPSAIWFERKIQDDFGINFEKQNIQSLEESIKKYITYNKKESLSNILRNKYQKYFSQEIHRKKLINIFS